MSFFSEFGEGLSSYGRAHRAIIEYKLSRYLVLPAIISLAYAVGYFVLFFALGSQIEVGGDLPWYISWMGGALDWLLRVGFWILMAWLFWLTYKFAIQTLLSPVLGALSENLERKMRGREPVEMGWQDYIQDMIRALKLSLRNLFMELLLTLVAGWIPIVGVIFVFLISAFYTGFGFMDFVLERKRYTISESVRFARKHSGLCTGIGVVANLSLLIPIFGWMIMPSYSTAAATLETMDELEELKTGNSGGGTGDPFARV